MEERWRRKFLDVKHQVPFFTRLLAMFFDMITLFIALVTTGIFTTIWMIAQSNAPNSENMTFIRQYIWEHEFHLFVINWILLGIVALSIQYIFPMFSKQTVGMMILGLYLRDEEAKEITKRRYLMREFLKLFLFPTLFLALIKRERPLYDQKSGTYLLH